MGAYALSDAYDMDRHVRDLLGMPIVGGSSDMQRNNWQASGACRLSRFEAAGDAMPKIDIAALPQRKARAIRHSSTHLAPSAFANGSATPAGSKTLASI